MEEIIKELLEDFTKIEWDGQDLLVEVENQMLSFVYLNTINTKDVFQNLASLENIMLKNFNGICISISRKD